MMIYLDGFGYVDVADIVKVEGGGRVVTHINVIVVSASVADFVRNAHRDFRVKEALTNIFKVSHTPANTVDMMPQNSLAFVAREAKELLDFLSE